MLNIYGLVMIIATFFNAISQIMLKKSALRTKNKRFLGKFLNATVFWAYVIFVMVCIVNTIAYRGVDFKYGGAINAIGQVFVLVLSVFFCNEKMTKERIVGSSLIIAGVIIYSLR